MPWLSAPQNSHELLLCAAFLASVLLCEAVNPGVVGAGGDAELTLGPGPCSINGVWNAIGSGDSKSRLVNISQPVGSDAVAVEWWLPTPTSSATGTLDVATHALNLSNGLRAVASMSSYPPSQDRDCTVLTFSEGSVWCLVGFCHPGPGPTPPGPPQPPTPYDPLTVMPEFQVAGAAAAGAFYPNGAPASYFMNYTGSTGFVIHLSGGGWRFASGDGSAMVPGAQPLSPDGYGQGGRAATADGHCYGGCDGILSDDPAMNPLFHGWNKVWIPISGTSFTGDVYAGPPYVRGKRIQTVVIADLLAHHGMQGATNVILTGGSSGGLATYLTCDRVGAQIRAANASTRYTCLADAGYFLHHDDIAGGNATAQQFKHSYYAWNSSGGTNSACVTALRPSGEDWKCIFAQYVAPFIKSELFVMQNLYDSWQINNILKIGCSGYGKPMTGCSAAQMAALQQYGADMRTALTPLTSNSAVGMFTPSCIAHCQSVANEHPIALWYWPGRWSIVDASSNTSLYPRDSFNAWYSGQTTGDSAKHIQKCAWGPKTCNKLCPDWT